MRLRQDGRDLLSRDVGELAHCHGGSVEQALRQRLGREQEWQQRCQMARILRPLRLRPATSAVCDVSLQCCLLLVGDAGAEVAVDQFDVGAARRRKVADRGVRSAEGIASSADQRINRPGAQFESLGHVLRALFVDITHHERGSVPRSDRPQCQEHVACIGTSQDLIGGVR